MVVQELGDLILHAALTVRPEELEVHRRQRVMRGVELQPPTKPEEQEEAEAEAESSFRVLPDTRTDPVKGALHQACGHNAFFLSLDRPVVVNVLLLPGV